MEWCLCLQGVQRGRGRCLQHPHHPSAV
ncbi:hypothetical protein E2C01_098100 [Portunus trituberculatus]|uniref:Uncharacterized protein n=1 Tax=Portunus trituberculatus TaxID=210409 RepID=A0A5B7K0D0_PORTR|nr:hypothetical protein [Portunus trituberculatus]